MDKVILPIASRARQLYFRVNRKHCPYARAARVWRASKKHNEKVNLDHDLGPKLQKRGKIIQLEKEKSMIDVGKSIGYIIAGAITGFATRGCI